MTKYMTKESLFEIQSIANPVLAPNEQEAVFIRTQINEKENNYNAHLFHIDLESGEITQWTYGNERVSSPQWSTDGKQVAFLVKRNEKQQLYILNRRGGKHRKLRHFQMASIHFYGVLVVRKFGSQAQLKKG